MKWTDDSTSWEPEQHLKGCKKLVDEYEMGKCIVIGKYFISVVCL